MRRAAWIALGVVGLLLATALGAGALGWRPSAPPPLPATRLEPTYSPDPRTLQTLANGSFVLHGASFVWEVRGFPEPQPGPLYAFPVRLHRTGGDGDVRVWPALLVMEGPDGGVWGRTDLDDEPGMAYVVDGHVESSIGAGFSQDPVEVRVRLVLHVYRDVGVGYVQEDDHEETLDVPLRLRSLGTTASVG